MSTLQEALEEEAREIREELGLKSTPAARRPSQSNINAIASVYGNSKTRLPGDLGRGDPRRSSALPGDLGPNDPRRRPSTADASTNSSAPRYSARSLSPAAGSHSFNAATAGPKMRRLSDAATRPPRKESDMTPDGGVRLPKDFDNESGSSDDDYEADNDASDGRGRIRTRVGNAVDLRDDSDDSDESEPARPTTIPPEDEHAAQDPTITVTPPTTATDTSHLRRSGVHPSTAFDFNASNNSTPVHSDDEENLDDLRRAQRLSLTISPIHSTPSAHRVIRQVIRGDYGFFQREAEEGRRRQRVYLVATDLSSEAEYALEWTIGTVLRDGDTLLAVYAVNEEAGSSGASEGVEIGHGADVVKDTASIVGSLAAQNVSPGGLPRDSSTARLAYGEKEGMSRAERERFRAAEDISQRCVKLLRKTRLQVRVVVEVFHCKSPRHMITEVVSHAFATYRASC